MVKIGSKVLALGVTDTQITLLSELSSNPELEFDSREDKDSEKIKKESIFQKIKTRLSL